MRARHICRARRAGCNGATHRRKSPPLHDVRRRRTQTGRARSRSTSHATRRRRKSSNAPGSTDSINLRRTTAALDEKCLGGGAAEVGIDARGIPAARVAPVLQKPRPAGRGTCPLTPLRARLLVLRRLPALRPPTQCSTQRPSLPRVPAHATSPAANPCPPPAVRPRWRSAPS